LFAQTKETAKNPREQWLKIREAHGYKRSDNYKGPDTENYYDPSDIRENGSNNSGGGNHQPYQGTPYNSKDLEQGKNPSNPNGTGGNGTIEEDPNIEPAESVDVPEMDGPDMPNIEGPNISAEFWKWLGIILLVLAIAFLIYYMIKNRNPREVSVAFEPLLEDMNPAEIPKTELELRLEEAKRNENYKECVRIYFLFAMKDMIDRKRIFWKKEKTNMHYLIEMQGYPSTPSFEKIMAIYDLVWYGDYTIDKNSYRHFEPTLIEAYHKIESDR
jgi:hypothetical protein